MFDRTEFQKMIQDAVNQTLNERESPHVTLNDGRLAYTEPEAAAKLGVNRHQIRDWRLQGKLRAHRPGRAWMYDREELIADFRQL